MAGRGWASWGATNSQKLRIIDDLVTVASVKRAKTVDVGGKKARIRIGKKAIEGLLSKTCELALEHHRARHNSSSNPVPFPPHLSPFLSLMAVATQHSSKAPRHVSHSHSHPAQPRASRQRFVSDLSQCLFDCIIQLLPTADELAVKEDVRKLLERLIRTIEPQSRLFSFGSTANGFSLRNSGKQPHISPYHNLDPTICIDMDLCCLIDAEERLSATDLVTMLGDLLERGMLHPSPHSAPSSNQFFLGTQKQNSTSSHYLMLVYL